MYTQSFQSRQQGMALVIGLILLLVMTLLSVTAMRGTMMQERMVGSLQDQQRAFQAAEAGLRDAERILEQAALPAFISKGLYEFGDNRTRPDWEDPDADRKDTGALVYDEDPLKDVSSQPQYFIERLPAAPGPGASLEAGTAKEDWKMYKIQARGFGASESSVVVLESTFRR
jgi:type IV pilus assembly protein PilX